MGSRVVKFKLRRISCAGRVVRDETADIGRGQVENPDSLKMCGGGWRSSDCSTTGQTGRALVYLHSSATDPRAVQLLHGVLRVSGVLHQDEGKAWIFNNVNDVCATIPNLEVSWQSRHFWRTRMEKRRPPTRTSLRHCRDLQCKSKSSSLIQKCKQYKGESRERREWGIREIFDFSIIWHLVDLFVILTYLGVQRPLSVPVAAAAWHCRKLFFNQNEKYSTPTTAGQAVPLSGWCAQGSVRAARAHSVSPVVFSYTYYTDLNILCWK